MVITQAHIEQICFKELSTSTPAEPGIISGYWFLKCEAQQITILLFHYF